MFCLNVSCKTIDQSTLLELNRKKKGERNLKTKTVNGKKVIDTRADMH